MEEIKEQIKLVVEARRKSQEMADKKKALYDEFRVTHRELFEDVVVAAEVVSEAEDKLRELTIKAYNETGSKTPAPGVGVREMTTLTYDSVELRLQLKLDKTAFEKIAKADKPDFVKVNKEPQATIATDLAEVKE